MSPVTDAAGKVLLPGDHVFVPATIAKINSDGSVVLLLDHANYDEHAVHKTAVEAWRNRPVHQATVACPPPPLQTQTLTVDCGRHVEFHSRPDADSPIFSHPKLK